MSIAIVTAGCGGSAATISNAPSADKQPVAGIPLPQSEPATYTPPSLPPRSDQLPPLTVPLIDVYRSGSADVLR